MDVSLKGVCPKLIININDTHWVCASNIGCRYNTIAVYDSLPASSMGSKRLQVQVAAILHINEKCFELQYIDIQRQCGGSDCALFAIANCTALCMGEDPQLLRYNQWQMRQHLEKCYELGTMQLFPHQKIVPRVKRQRVCASFTVVVYCLCRQVYTNGSAMIQCHVCQEWYHDKCVPNIGQQFSIKQKVDVSQLPLSDLA